MQTILGSGGAIGENLARELLHYTKDIRLVSRNPVKVNESDTLFPANLNRPSEVEKAIEGSKVVYLTVGFDYNHKIWAKQWPPLVQNVIEACKNNNSHLVFFDNIYMYDREHLREMDEKTPIHPTSRKGKIRAMVAHMILKEMEKKELKALIARSADFLWTKNSIPYELVYKNLKKDKKAIWMADAKKIHNFTFVPDAAKGTAILGNTEDAYNQVWHLPTIRKPLNGEEWIHLFAAGMKVHPKYMTLPKWLMKTMGVFNPLMSELHEMAYQYDRDYYFDSRKFEERFGYHPATPEEAVKKIIELGDKSDDK